MSDKVKSHLFSFGITFVSTFLLTFGASLQGITSGDITADTLISLLIAAGRTAVKLVFEDLLKTNTLMGVK